MNKLSRTDLMSLEEYAQSRSDYRTKVIAHKKNRQVGIGENATLYFEDRLTMQYQVQEILRIEKIFEAQGIEEELEAYNPLIPDGSNLKATFMLEYEDVDERKRALSTLIGVERKVWIQVEGFEKVYPIANEDLERETEDKTSAVHFLRFEFDFKMIAALKEGSNLAMGIDHENYQHTISSVPENVVDSLVQDFTVH